jgi:hypothetical protein
MSFTQFGDIKYKFGYTNDTQTSAVAAAAIETATGLAPQELSISGEPEFVAEAEGGGGTVEAVAVAQKKYSFTLTGVITDREKFMEDGLSFTHDGKFFIVTGDQDNKASKEFQKGQLTGMCWAGVTGLTPEE